MATIITGAIALARLTATQMTLVARARSVDGIQRETTDEQLGKAPASPAPKRKRAARSEENPVTAPVNAVKADHQRTIRNKTVRGPMRSASNPLGASSRRR